MHQPEHRNVASGFSLAEVIVVVIILGIAAGIVTPYVISTNDTALLSAGRTLASALQYAQSEAITSQVKVKVSFNTATNSYTLANIQGTTSTTMIHPIDKSDYVVNFSTQPGFEGVTLSNAVFGAGSVAEVTFDEMGSPDNSGTVTLTAGASAYTVSVSEATGTIVANPS